MSRAWILGRCYDAVMLRRSVYRVEWNMYFIWAVGFMERMNIDWVYVDTRYDIQDDI